MAKEGSSIPDMENNIPIENGHDVPHNDSTYVDPDSDQSNKEANAIQVDWDGEGDPRNPLNWGKFKRYSQVFVVSAITLLTSLAASMFSPGVSYMMKEFHSTNEELGILVISIYVLGLAIGPLILAPMSEQYGRLVVYHTCMIIFLVFTIACAVSESLTQLIVFRFFAGCSGSAPIAMGGGTVSDVFPPQTRGAAMSIWAIGPLLGPVIGPVAGGFLAENEGWRWTFWVLAIATGVMVIVSAILLRETYGVVLLERIAEQRRRETGDNRIKSRLAPDQTPGEMWRLALIRPLKMLTMPMVFSLSSYTALCYGFLFLFFSTFTMVFEEQYGFSIGISGLTYIGLGVGMIAGLFINRLASDRIAARLAQNNIRKPEHRLPIMIFLGPLIPVGLFWYGWSTQAHTHWIVPIIGTAVVGIGMLGIFLPAQTYLVDAYTRYAASAIAANTLFRSILGSMVPLFGYKMYQSLGLGWGNSLLGFIAIAFLPLPLLFYKFGERIRLNSTANL